MKSWEIDHAILDALGIEGHNVQRVVIELESGSWPTVSVTRWLDGDTADVLVSVIDQFELRPIGDVNDNER